MDYKNAMLELWQSMPLEMKEARSLLRIEKFAYYFGTDKVYVSFSGGKDSTVLLHMVRRLFPNTPAVFCDTGLEYPEIKEFVKKQKNIEILKPKLTFKQVIENYGYPVPNKEQAMYIYEYQNTNSEVLKNTRLNGNKWDRGKISKKNMKFLNADFKVSHKCCDILKKNPAKTYERRTGKYPFIGSMAEESALRKSRYIKNGCNIFEGRRPTSQPMSFWTEQDVLKYIKKYNLDYASVYGELIESENGELKFTGCQRTGCIFCLFGVEYEDDEENRFLKLEKTHPQLHNYCMNNLGIKNVCEFMGVKYTSKEE